MENRQIAPSKFSSPVTYTRVPPVVSPETNAELAPLTDSALLFPNNPYPTFDSSENPSRSPLSPPVPLFRKSIATSTYQKPVFPKLFIIAANPGNAPEPNFSTDAAASHFAREPENDANNM